MSKMIQMFQTTNEFGFGFLNLRLLIPCNSGKIYLVKQKLLRALFQVPVQSSQNPPSPPERTPRFIPGRVEVIKTGR